MPIEVVRSTWETESRALEPVPFRLGDTDAPYPFTKLKESGDFASVSFSTVVLQNDHVQAVFCPDLGGRLLSFGPLLELPDRIVLDSKGQRGISWPHGLQVRTDREARLNSLGPVDLLIRDDLGAVFFHELVLGTELSWTLAASLEPNSSALSCELKLFNRSLFPIKCNAELHLDLPVPIAVSRGSDVVAIHADARDAGLVVQLDPSLQVSAQEHSLTVSSSSDPEFCLLPRMAQTLRFKLWPFSGIGSPQICGHNWIASLGPSLSMATSEDLSAKLFVQTSPGETFEAETSPSPAKPFIAELGATVTSLAVRTANSTDEGQVLQELASTSEPLRDIAAAECHAAAEGQRPSSVEGLLFKAIREQAKTTASPQVLRYLAHVWSSRLSSRENDHPTAHEEIEKALVLNGEDHLSWWHNARCKHLMGEDPESELLNAHFLAPLEPLLKLESYLSALLTDPDLNLPIQQEPDALLESLCALLELHEFQLVAKILNKSPDILQTPLVRYLYAWIHLREAGMDSEAASHVQRVAQAPLMPPFPWRRIEVLAVKELADRFPQDSRLATLVGLLRQFKLLA